MATLVDTSVLAVLIRKRPSEHDRAVRRAREEIVSGRGLISVVSLAELLVGASDASGAARLRELLRPVPVAPLNEEAGVTAGLLGAYARRRGATVPLPDLLIAATALRLEIPLLTVDSDFARGRNVALEDDEPDEDADLWKALRLDPAGIDDMLS